MAEHSLHSRMPSLGEPYTVCALSPLKLVGRYRELCIHASSSMQMADEEEDDEYERSGVTVPVADASDHKAALLASMASSAFLAPPTLPTPTAYPTPAAGVPTCQSIAGPGTSSPQYCLAVCWSPPPYAVDRVRSELPPCYTCSA